MEVARTQYHEFWERRTPLKTDTLCAVARESLVDRVHYYYTQCVSQLYFQVSGSEVINIQYQYEGVLTFLLNIEY
jgi:hypothetical protein